MGWRGWVVCWRSTDQWLVAVSLMGADSYHFQMVVSSMPNIYNVLQCSEVGLSYLWVCGDVLSDELLSLGEVILEDLYANCLSSVEHVNVK